jgi:hypothetical protein
LLQSERLVEILSAAQFTAIHFPAQQPSSNRAKQGADSPVTARVYCPAKQCAYTCADHKTGRAVIALTTIPAIAFAPDPVTAIKTARLTVLAPAIIDPVIMTTSPAIPAVAAVVVPVTKTSSAGVK